MMYREDLSSRAYSSVSSSQSCSLQDHMRLDSVEMLGLMEVLHM